MPVVISLGGSLIDLNEGTNYLKKLSEMIINVSKDYRLFLVVGGGKIARKYINFGRKFGMEEPLLDEIGIAATRLNATLISTLLKITKPIPFTTSDAASREDRIVVMGGTTPGHSTDMVGAELAEKVSAERFIIATDVDGIYDKDPKKYKDAKMFSEIEVEKLMQMCGTDWNVAGRNVIIDGPALEIIKNSKFETIVVNGRNIENLRQAIYGGRFVGTRIRTRIKK